LRFQANTPVARRPKFDGGREIDCHGAGALQPSPTAGSRISNSTVLAALSWGVPFSVNRLPRVVFELGFGQLFRRARPLLLLGSRS
jgi:hypothetical protein